MDKFLRHHHLNGRSGGCTHPARPSGPHPRHPSARALSLCVSIYMTALVSTQRTNYNLVPDPFWGTQPTSAPAARLHFSPLPRWFFTPFFSSHADFFTSFFYPHVLRWCLRSGPGRRFFFTHTCLGGASVQVVLEMLNADGPCPHAMS